jgi:hypothetical protein
MAHVKHIVQYLALVGLPFLGLLGVLRIGRDLTAPMAVHGTYLVTTTGGTGGSCLRELLADSHLGVTQSGERIQVRLGLPAVRLAGQLTGNRLHAEGQLPATTTCPSGEPIRFEGLATRVAGQVRLDLQLRAECAACGSLTFEASRARREPVAGS